MNKQMIIMSAVSGMGKSTYAKSLTKDHPSAIILSADDYHINTDGVYDWKIENLSAAHLDCKIRTKAAIEAEIELIIIDNTNISPVDAAWYYEEAKIAGYEPKIVRLHGDFDAAFARNVHGVPEKTHKNQRRGFEKAQWPTYWNVENVEV